MPVIAKPFCRLLTIIIEPIVLWIMQKVNAIPVFKGNSKIIKTLESSVDSLAAGVNIAIFLDDVVNNSCGRQKNSGFVHIAREYYFKYGKVLRFYPVYISRKNREISIGIHSTAPGWSQVQPVLRPLP
ncbi:MAG: hypothetical protein HPY58_01620 [Firmicutes bacterium]|nr:hypothetical protein [Bacillota bacterium]